MKLSSSEVPAPDRFAWWRELTAQEVIPTAFRTDRRADFYASVKTLQLGSVIVSELECTELRAKRPPQLIRRSDPERWMLMLVSKGSVQIEQSCNHARLTPSDMVLYDSSRPFESQLVDEDRVSHTLLLQLPRKALPLPEQILRSQVARTIPSTNGSAALLSRFMEATLEHAGTLHPNECARLETVVLGLMATVFEARVGAERVTLPQTRQQTLLHKVKAFILGHLHETHLSPATIAAANHISVRYLHHMFHEDGQSVGEFVRRRRLERCHSDLTDPQLANWTAADVGARWGFQDIGTFNRAFKAAYGIPPGEHRRRHSQTQPSP